MIQPLGFESGYKPDLMLIDPAELSKEPLWERESVITLGSSVKLLLLVAVVSTNWPDDYAREEVKTRVGDLIAREKEEALSAEETTELNLYIQLEHIMRLAKARARQLMA